jgi:hypothetical protein
VFPVHHCKQHLDHYGGGEIGAGKFVVEARRRPDGVGGEQDVRKSSELAVGRWTHIHIWKTGTIGEGYVITIRRDDALLSTMAPGGIMDKIAKSSELTSGVDGMPLSIVGILMKDEDGRTLMSLDEASGGHKR